MNMNLFFGKIKTLADTGSAWSRATRNSTSPAPERRGTLTANLRPQHQRLTLRSPPFSAPRELDEDLSSRQTASQGRFPADYMVLQREMIMEKECHLLRQQSNTAVTTVTGDGTVPCYTPGHG